MSGESALKNAVKRITHKERAQPSARKKLGELEKHKDYKVRSKEFKNKRRYVDSLKSKAAERNPDEFYFGMHKAQVKKGRHTEIPSEGLAVNVVKSFKKQDLGNIILQKVTRVAIAGRCIWV